MNDSKKVVVVELNPYHDECLYSQCLMLRCLGKNVMVVANSSVSNRVENSLKDIGIPTKFLPFGSGIKGLGAILSFYRLVRSMGDIHLHFNTAQGNVAWRLFLLPFPKRIKITGVIHNVPKLRTSLGQRIISRQIRSYTLLSDLLVPLYNKMCQKPAIVVYPAFYPRYEDFKLHKPIGEIWIVIPGAVSFGRRDYASLFQPKSLPLNGNIKIILLGNINKADGLAVLSMIKGSGVEYCFLTFNEYVPNSLFFSYIEKCDYIMPLIHPSKALYAKYLKEKISGTYDLAIAYRKPMLCPMEMSKYEDFADTSFFYDVDNIIAFLNSLTTEKQEKELFTLPKWTLEYQTEQMRKLISDE